MKTAPRVSVIMGAYNCSGTLKAAVQSIREQSFPDWEMIICDDASTDSTYTDALALKSEDERIIVIRNDENRKLAYSLNQCLKLAGGEYIARMDADDISKPDRFSRQVAFLDAHPEYAVVGTAAEISNGESIIEERRMREVPQTDDVLLSAPFIHPSIMMRKAVYDELGGYTVAPRTTRGQDRDLWFRFYARGYRGYNLQDPYLVYFERPGDYKKRSFIGMLRGVRTSFRGYRLLKVPFWKYFLLLKNVITFFVPQKLKRYYRNKTRGKVS